MTVPIPGGPSAAGVIDHTVETPEIPIHLEDAVAVSPVTGQPLKQQVVQVEDVRGISVMVGLLRSMDRRLKTLEEHFRGFSSD